jgi:wyosine [tRNA(Phe)-imidazoG37] synthetase (radical SAM superfamily)
MNRVDQTDGFLNPYKILGILGTPADLHEWVESKHFPTHVKFDLTGACNLQCGFCNGTKAQEAPSSKHIPWFKLKQTLQELADHGTRAVTFTGGGEPLLYPEFESCLCLTQTLNLEFGVTTNAALPISENMTAALAHASWIRASVNAGSSETYQLVHQPRNPERDTYQQVIHNLERLKTACPPATRLGCSFLIDKHNWQEILMFTRQIRSLGLDYVQFKLVYIPAKTSMLESGEYCDFGSKIPELISAARGLETANFKILFPVERSETAIKTYQSCWLQHFSAHVGIDSLVYPCCVQTYQPQAALGSLLEQSFSEIWLSAVRKETARRFGAGCPRCWWDRINTVLDAMANPIDDMEFI